MPAKPTTVQAYLDALPDDRREALEAIRKVINDNIGPEFEEGIQYGMIGWYLPHDRYPLGYHCDPRQPLPFASLASQKKHIGIYLFCVYCDPEGKEQFAEDWQAAGKKLDMGAGCVRVKDLDGVAMKVLARTIKRTKAKAFIQQYESMLTPNHRKQRVKLAAKLGVKVSEEGLTEKAIPVRERPSASKTTNKKAVAKKAGRKAPSNKAVSTATKKKAGKKAAKAPGKKKAVKSTAAKKPSARKKRATRS